MVKVTSMTQCAGGHHITVETEGGERHQFSKDELLPAAEVPADKTARDRAEVVALADLAVKQGAKTFEEVKAAVIAKSAEAVPVEEVTVKT